MLLEEQEINDFFGDIELNEEQIEKIYDYLEENNIDVLRKMDDDDVPDDDLLLDDTEDLETIDLSVPEGVGFEEFLSACT